MLSTQSAASRPKRLFDGYVSERLKPAAFARLRQPAADVSRLLLLVLRKRLGPERRRACIGTGAGMMLAYQPGRERPSRRHSAVGTDPS
jgi:hypothetical protein